MNVLDDNLIPAAVARIGRKADEIHMRLKKWRPGVFGSPIRQHMLQLYREDAEFSTTVSIPHHLSFLAPDTNITIEYNVVAYDRNGKLIGEKKHLVRHFETLQIPLETAVGHSLDEYGIFAISCLYDTYKGIDFLGQTSPQYMTMFLPRNLNNAPQIVHSHKYLDRLPPLRRKVVRHSSLFEGGENLTGISYFFLNSSNVPVRGKLRITSESELISENELMARSHGVCRVDVPLSGAGPYRMACELDRVTNHRKPIAFRTFASGMITASHT
jgi:hypothetical protein